MNFIETIFESINKALKQTTNEIPYDIETYCIGSGSNFEVHTNISLQKALKLYEKLKERLPLGKKIEEKQIGKYKLESWHTLESETGITYTFMFQITKLIYHDPNKVIEEWNKRKENNPFQKLKEQIDDTISKSKI